MKKIILFSVAIMMATVSMPAQSQDQIRLQEHLMLKDGKMFQVRDQEQIQLNQQLKLQNGILINTDGSYQLQNQKQLKLKNGECLDMVGNRYASQQEFRQQMQSREQALAQEHLMFQSGQMFRVQNQQKIQLMERLTLQNGTVVNPNGSVQLKDRKQLQLKDGECLDMDGKRYETQDRFRDKMVQRNMDRMDKERGKEKMSPGKGKKNN
jgi:hypothetical protein